jgi:single-stranded-DNA-specific exonuclease
LKEIAENGANLVITIDLGITAVEEVLYAKSLGLEVIITDHHLPQEILPNTLILNPKQPGDTYPDNMLCGSGVFFKLVQGFLKKYQEEFSIKKGADKWMLDMVGLATLADMVPLLKENRALAYYGLKVLRKTKRPGLLQLLRRVNIQSHNLQEDDITFSICPKLNAASRMDSPKRAYELLSASDEGEAGIAAMNLTKMNDERKTLVATMMKSVKKTFSHEERIERSVVVIGDPSWRAGVLGLVAGKIVEEYKKPAFVWGLEGGSIIKGSCRSDGTVNLVEMMMNLPDNALLEFGGHALAGGFSVSHEEIHFLEERLIKAYDKTEKVSVESAEEINFDDKLTLDEVNEKTFNEIDRLAPFGAGNPKPTFLFENIEIVDVKIFGKAKDHLELAFKDSRGRTVKAISFFKKPEDFGDKVKVGGKINLIATIEKSVFGYRKEIRLRIVEIK